MIANMTIANKTKSPIWSNGAIAFIIDFKTTCKPRLLIIQLENLKMEKKSIQLKFINKILIQ